jgi:hypothetical protein
MEAMIASADGSMDGRNAALAERFRHETDPEHGLFGLVQEFHLPFGVLLQAAGNAANEIAADLGHFSPGGFATFKLRSLIGSARIAAIADTEKIQRHIQPMCRSTPQPAEDRQV